MSFVHHLVQYLTAARQIAASSDSSWQSMSAVSMNHNEAVGVQYALL